MLNLKQQKALDFLQALELLLQSGTTLKSAIDSIGSVTNKQGKLIAATIKKSLAQGKGLSNGLTAWYPAHVIKIITVGENSGTLDKALAMAVESLQQHHQMKKHIINNLILPLTVMLLALMVSVVIKETVLKNFAHIIPFAHWPNSDKLLFYFASFIENWSWMLVVTIGLFAWSTYQFLRLFSGNIRDQIDQLPLLNLYSHLSAAYFLQMLGLLTSGGIIIKKSLSILSPHVSPFLKRHITRMEYYLRAGVNHTADILNTGLLPKQVLIQIKHTCNTASFATTLMDIGRKYQQRNEKQAVLILKSIGMLLTVIAGIIIATILLGTYSFSQIN